jgi:hypothetical protein
MFEPEDFNELKELNNFSSNKQILPGGEFAYEKEGFEDDDFSGEAEGGEDNEADWGEAEDFGGEGGGQASDDDEDFADASNLFLNLQHSNPCV